jgi:hypothetical protein
VPVPAAIEVGGNGLLRVDHEKAALVGNFFMRVPAAKFDADCAQPWSMTRSGNRRRFDPCGV